MTHHDEPALSPADADVVRRDPALPGLATLLSPAAMLQRLRLARPDADLRAAEPTYVRYKPATSCIAGFRLDVGGTPVYAYARTLACGSVEKLSKLAGTPGADTPLGTPTVHLSDCSTVVSLFPNDAALPSLRLLVDHEGLAAVLAKVLPAAGTRTDWRGESAFRVLPLAYKPERRFVGQLDLIGRPIAVLKFYTDAGYAVAQRNAKMVKSRGLLRVPRRLGRSERHGLVALQWLPGRPLSEVLADPAAEPDWNAVARLGAGVAEFAAKGSARFRHRPGGSGAIVATVIEVARAVGRLWPPLAARAATLAERVACHLAENPGRDRPVHGDFYAKQVLLDGGELGVVDWDEAGLGEPASDVGNFIAHLERHALAGRMPADRVGAAGEALRVGFESASGRSIADRVTVHTAAQLLAMATHPFRGRERDWPDRTAAILGRVEGLLSAGTPATRSCPIAEPRAATSPLTHAARPAGIPISDPFGVATDAGNPFARDALDPEAAREVLRRALSAAGFPVSLELRVIRVIRHKPGRRFLVEYELSGARTPPDGSRLTVIGKVRTKGADERTHELMETLWSSSFGPTSPDGISVPRPLGIVAELGMTLQLKAPGEPASRVLGRGGATGIALAARLADVAHKLHCAAAPPTRTHTRADELRILHERLGRVAADHPGWAGSIERLSAACGDLLASVPPLPTAGVHRDFYPDQVLVDGARLYLLDLDLYCRGEPPLDVGNCLAHLTEQALRTSSDATAWLDREQAMEERYLEAAGGDIPRAAIRAYAAVALARHVHISTLFADRRHLTCRLLELSHRRVDDSPAPPE